VINLNDISEVPLNDRIVKLSEGKGVKSIAVINFLSSLGDLTRQEALANLNLDANLYKWNAATVNAIRKGILDLVK